MNKKIGGVTIIQYDFYFCKKCDSIEYTDENKCKKCNNNYILFKKHLDNLED